MDNILTLDYLINKEGSIGKAWQLIRRHFNKNGYKSTLNLWNRFKKETIFKKWAEQESKNIIILATPHTIFIAKLISNSLNNIGLDSNIQINKNISHFTDDLYIVVCPQSFKKLPKNRIVFQLEQSISDRWFTPQHIKKLEESLIVMDYSLKNINFLTQHLPLSQLYYVPISSFLLDQETSAFVSDDQAEHTYQYDVLFYGDTNNERRQHYLHALKSKFKVKVINNVYGKDIWSEIKKARIVVNIHYYEDALLETTRLHECLSNNAVIISEKSSDFQDHQDLTNFVDFVDVGNIQQMIERVQFWLTHQQEYTLLKSKIYQYIKQEQHLFDFYFYRVFLSLDLLSFEAFYNKTYKIWKPSSQFWCLGLPEAVERQKEFSNELLKYKDIWSFPGLRHFTPWIGCGMSYKYMLQYAQDNSFDKITICEDDVLFPDNFKNTLDDINQYIDKKEWNIFSGYITDLHPNSQVEKLDSQGKFNFIKTDKTTGMVFNIYHNNIFQYIADWDHKNHDLCTNTIDRYIENHSALSIITTVPYIVKHKENVCTTLWNRTTKPFSYCQMVNESQKIIEKKTQT